MGCFDPYSDDPRLGVQKIALCKYTAKMVVAGTAGQVGQRGCCRAPLGSSLGETWHGGGASGLQTPVPVREGLQPPACSRVGCPSVGLAHVPPTINACPPQVLVMELSDEKSEHAVSVATVDLLQDREGFTWKGHDRLAPRNGPLPFAPGFQPSVLVQCVPPAAVTAVTLHSEWNLVAFGTSHGFGLFDYYRRNPVLARYG